jgi:hypothetical protein
MKRTNKIKTNKQRKPAAKTQSRGIAASYARPHTSQSMNATVRGGVYSVVSTESIGTIVGQTTDYHISEIALNPALESFLPRLFRWGEGHETYECDSLEFTIHPAVGTNNDGIVGLTVIYDYYKPVPADYTAFTLTNGAQYGPLYHPIRYKCDRSALMNPRRKFTKPTAASEGDLKNVHIGKLCVMTLGVPSKLLGTLEVKYHFRLYNPIKTEVSSGALAGETVMLSSPMSFDLMKESSIDGQLPIRRVDDQVAEFMEDYQGVGSLRLENTVTSGAEFDTDPLIAGAENTCSITVLDKEAYSTSIGQYSAGGTYAIDAKRGDKLNVGINMLTSSADTIKYLWNFGRAVLSSLKAFGLVDSRCNDAPFNKYGHRQPGAPLPVISDKKADLPSDTYVVSRSEYLRLAKQ